MNGTDYIPLVNNFRQAKMRVQLAAHSLLRMEGDSRGVIILCRSGSCWITQEGDPRDYYLRDEKSFTINQEGLVVVQALADTDIVVSPDVESHL